MDMLYGVDLDEAVRPDAGKLIVVYIGKIEEYGVIVDSSALLEFDDRDVFESVADVVIQSHHELSPHVVCLFETGDIFGKGECHELIGIPLVLA